MKCFSRATLGVVIGITNILIYIGVCFAMINLYQDSNNNTDEFKILLGVVITVCIIMSFISGLLIVGVIKREDKFIWPWLILSVVVFICNFGRALFGLVSGITNNIPLATLLMTLAIDVLALVIQALLVWPIYTLCRDIARRSP